MARKHVVNKLLPVLLLALFLCGDSRLSAGDQLGMTPSAEVFDPLVGYSSLHSQAESSPEASDREERPELGESDMGPELGESGGATAELPRSQPVVSLKELGNWTDYNGVIFGDAVLYDSRSGGGLAVGGEIAFYRDCRVGSTYATEYDPTLHIGEYKNEEELPALLLGGDQLQVGGAVTALDVFGGAVTASPALHVKNSELPVGLTPRANSSLQEAEQQLLDEWFAYQRKMAAAASRLMLQANDVSINLDELASGSYLDEGPERFENQHFQVGGEVYRRALFVTVRTDSEVDFGQWWPVHSIIHLDVNWALDYDLLVFSFPDAVNVTMNSSTFLVENMSHWSTTVDAWVGERGMEERRALSEKVVYNFPNAGSVEADQALIQGTILAPNATFTGIGLGDNGHIYGHIVAKNYETRGNFTIHAFALTHWVYDIVEDAVTGEKHTGSVALRSYLHFRGDDTSIRVGDADFVLEDSSGNYFDGAGGSVSDMAEAALYTTAADRDTIIPNLPLGDYTLVNVGAPEGFVVNRSNIANRATYHRYPLSLRTQGETVQAVRHSEPEFMDLHFRKVDDQTGRGLPGATFTILRERDEYQDATIGGTYTSDASGHFAVLRVPAGVYHLVEVETPEGYELLPGGEYTFQVRWESGSGLVVRSLREEPLTATEEAPLEIGNPAGSWLNAAVVVKYARDSNEPDTFYPLPQAVFQLYRYSGETASWHGVEENALGESVDIVTNEYGYSRLQHLPQGRYRLVETRAPAGYALSNPLGDTQHADAFPRGYAYEFEFAREGSFYTAYLPAQALELDLTVASVGAPFGEPGPLPGATFRLEHLLSDGKTWEELVYSDRTGPDGTVLLEGLAAGVYRLTQLSAAAGYRPLEPAVISFSAAFDRDGAPVLEAVHDGAAVGEGTAPVGLDWVEGARLTVHNEAKTRGLLVYKLGIAAGEEVDGDPARTYLEGAVFRLRRRADVRSGWQDYGESFSSRLLYDEDGAPSLDSTGAHMAAALLEPGLLYGDYQLVETRTPEGYQSSSDIQVTFEDGEQGMQLHLFSVTESMTGAGQLSTYTALNYAAGYNTSLIFRAVDFSHHETPVRGAVFALYQCEEDHVHDDVLTPDSCWAASIPVSASSDRDGVVRFADIISGEYLLREYQAPAGYQLPNTMWRISVDIGKDMADIRPTSGSAYSPIPVEEGEQVRWLLPNRRQWTLPVTGGGGTRGLVRTGIALLLAGGALLLGLRRRVDNGENRVK